jgi:hypothetical protein
MIFVSDLFLSSYQMVSDNNDNTGLLQAKAHISLQIEELKRDLEAVERLIQRHVPLNGHINGANNSTAIFQATIKPKYYAATYSKDLTWKQKIFFVLTEIGSGYVDDVSKKLREHESSMSEETATKNATLYLSILYNKGEIKADTTSRKYKYSA